MYALSDLKNKEAIDISCGRYLGPIMDAAIDLQTGHIVGIILPGGLFGAVVPPLPSCRINRHRCSFGQFRTCHRRAGDGIIFLSSL